MNNPFVKSIFMVLVQNPIYCHCCPSVVLVVLSIVLIRSVYCLHCPQSIVLVGNPIVPTVMPVYCVSTVSIYTTHHHFRTCLVFNHPRSKGWSLHGQVYSTFFCLSSSSIGLQTTF